MYQGTHHRIQDAGHSQKDGCKIQQHGKRQIHLDPKTAEEFGLKDKQIVSVKVGENTGRALTFGDVVIRVSENYAPAMHIDTDESNAACLGGTVDGEIIA